MRHASYYLTIRGGRRNGSTVYCAELERLVNVSLQSDSVWLLFYIDLDTPPRIPNLNLLTETVWMSQSWGRSCMKFIHLWKRRSHMNNNDLLNTEQLINMLICRRRALLDFERWRCNTEVQTERHLWIVSRWGWLYFSCIIRTLHQKTKSLFAASKIRWYQEIKWKVWLKCKESYHRLARFVFSIEKMTNVLHIRLLCRIKLH